MDPVTITLLVVVGLIVLLGLFFWATYNGLVKLGVRVDEAWSDITVQLKRRADLIPNLVESVKGYAAHEKEVFALADGFENVADFEKYISGEVYEKGFDAMPHKVLYGQLIHWTTARYINGQFCSEIDLKGFVNCDANHKVNCSYRQLLQSIEIEKSKQNGNN